MNVIEMPISYGEAFDKLSILDIKLHRISDAARIKQAQHEFNLLKERLTSLTSKDGMDMLYQQLYYINELIWDVENRKRELDLKGKVFTKEFSQTAREVYLLNDKRAEIKRYIDATLSSSIHEVKSHPSYKKGKLFLITHAGLGDMIMCNGLVRYKCLQHSEVRILVNKAYLDTVKFMYRDLNNISYEVYDTKDPNKQLNSVCTIYNHGKAPERLKELISEGYEVLGLGDHSLERLKSDNPPWLTKGYDFCEAMYAQADVPLSVRQRYAFIVRDRKREEQFYNRIVSVIGPKYKVFHDDPDRNLLINRSLQITQTNIPEFHVATRTISGSDVWSSNIFDYCTLIDRAEEYHGFDSSFFAMLNLVKSQCKNIYLHTYIRTLHCKVYSNIPVIMIKKDGIQLPSANFAIINDHILTFSEAKQIASSNPNINYIACIDKDYKLSVDLGKFLTVDEPLFFSDYAIVAASEFNEIVIYNAQRIHHYSESEMNPHYKWVFNKLPVSYVK